MRETVLEVNDLNVWYRSGTGLRKRRHQVLHDVSFTLYRGEILGLVGESGSGKSTLARAVPVSYTHLDVYKRQAPS